MSRGLLLPAILLMLTSGPVRSQVPLSDEDRAWSAVQDFFNKREWVMAVVEAEDFARRYPKSIRVPQAYYQAACGYLLLQKPNEGNEAFKRLVTEHFDSGWTQLAQLVHLDAATLFKLADDLRAEGRTKRLPLLFDRAAALYGLFGQRFPQDNRLKNELVYKWADCAWMTGKEQEATVALLQLSKADQGDWSKLAALRLGQRDKFAKEMGDLLDLATSGEERTLFLELADRFQKELPKDASLQCQYLRAHCVDGPKRLAMLREICAERFDSPWAGEAAFGLAEHAFEQGKVAEAQAVYRALAARYPDSPRAERLTTWATWIDRQEADRKELERLLVECLQRFDARKGGVALTVNIQSDAFSFPIDGRIAYHDRQVMIRAALGQVGFAIGMQRPSIAWYRFMNQSTMQRVEKASLPVLTFKLKEFPKGQLNFQANVGMNDDPNAVSDIEIEPAVGGLFATTFSQGKHLHRQARADGGSEFVFEWPHRNPHVIQTLTVQFTNKGSLREATYRSSHGANKKLIVAVKDIVLGAPIAREEFDMPNQPGVEVKNLPEVNPIEIIGQVMNLFVPAYQTLAKELPKGP